MDVYSKVFGLAIIILGAYLAGRFFKWLKMPMVVGYLIAGIFLGPSFFNLVPQELNEGLDLVKILGLGMIAILIGGELEIKRIKNLGKSIIGITVVQILGASIVVFLASYFILKLPLSISLILGALATATAPASPVTVIREYEAKGPFTTTLLGVVALDDAMCIIFFGLVTSFVAMSYAAVEPGFNTFIIPFIEILGSLAIGAITGFIMSRVLPFLPNRHHKVAIFIGIILLNSGIAYQLNLSPLMVNMVCGFIIANFYKRPAEINFLEDIETPVLIVFFALAGAGMHLNILAENWFSAVVYIVARGFGKVGGAFLGAYLSNSPKVVQKYLGFAMFSKAGLTIGLLMIVQDIFPSEIATTIVTIELAAIAVCELIGPLGTRYAILSSGEAFGGKLVKKEKIPIKA